MVTIRSRSNFVSMALFVGCCIVVGWSMVPFTAMAQQQTPWTDAKAPVDSAYVARMLSLPAPDYSVSFDHTEIDDFGTITKTVYVTNVSQPYQCTPAPILDRAQVTVSAAVGEEYRLGRGVGDYEAHIHVTIVPWFRDLQGNSFQGTAIDPVLVLRNYESMGIMEPEARAVADIVLPPTADRLEFLEVRASTPGNIDPGNTLDNPQWGPLTTGDDPGEVIRASATYEEFYRWPVNRSTGVLSTAAIASIASPVADNVVTFDWSLATQCNDTIPNFEFQLLRLFNVDPAKVSNEEEITAEVDWSQALSIETGRQQSLSLTLAEGTGYYTWRVRPIGSMHPGGVADDRNWGEWTAAPANGSLAISGLTAVGPAADDPMKAVFFYDQFDDDRNWIYSRVFSEGDERSTKIGERITYADGLQNVAQTQAKIASKGDKLLIGQTILDYSGRPAVQSLPIPVTQDGFGYVSNLMRHSSDGGVTATLYRAVHFDDDNNVRDPLAVLDRTSAGALEPTHYYSNRNDDLRVPSADGYPFSRTLFGRDGTNRPAEVGGPGDAHRIGDRLPQDLHTVRTRSGMATDQELIWLFGDEAPSARTVRKVIAIDQNNVATVSFIDGAGKTLATALSSAVVDGQTQLALESDPVSPEYDPAFPAQQINQEITQFDEPRTNGMVASTRLALETETEIELEYHLTPSKIEAACGSYCATCDYVVDVLVFDLENPGNVVLAEPFHVEVTGAQLACSTAVGGITPITKTLTLPAGTYRIERRIRTANTDPATVDEQTSPLGRTYRQMHLEEIRKIAENQLGLPLDDANVPGPLKAIFEVLEDGTTDEIEDALATYLVGNDYVIATECCTLRVPKEQCAGFVCPENADFESLFLDRWDPESDNDLDDFFYHRGDLGYPEKTFPAAGADVDPNSPGNELVNGNGAFNRLVDFMVSEGGYDRCDLWQCWMGLVEMWGRIGTTDGSGSPTMIDEEFDLLDAFLTCAGKKYDNTSTYPYSTGANTNGYLDKAWRRFKLHGTTNCDTQGMPWPAEDPKWDALYECTHAASRTLDDRAEDLLPEDCQGSSPNAVDCREAMAAKIEDQCEQACENRFWPFVLAIVDEYHKGPSPSVVQGDRDADGGLISPYDVSLREIYCMAQALVDNCLTLCTLDITESNGQYSVPASTSENLRNAMTGNFEIRIPNAYGMCPDSFDLVTSTPSANTGELLVAHLNRRLAELAEAAGMDGYADPNFVDNELQTAYASFVGATRACWFDCGELDSDGDGIGDDCDPCPELANQDPDPNDNFDDHDGDGCPDSIDGPWKCDSTQSGCNTMGVNVARTPNPESLDGTMTILSHGDIGHGNPYTDDATCPTATTLPEIFQQGAGITGRFLLGPNCELKYERTCTRGTTPVVHTVTLCDGVCAQSCSAEVCFRWKAPDTTAYQDRFKFTVNSCDLEIRQAYRRALSAAASECIEAQVAAMEKEYTETCETPEAINDDLFVRYQVQYVHFTLYYYDRAGNLIKTVQPKGVALTSIDRMQHPSHGYETGYEYNSLGQVLRQRSSDAGMTEFRYDSKGRLRFSIDGRQRQLSPSRFSYTKYDELGRVVESGEAVSHVSLGVSRYDLQTMAEMPDFPMYARHDVVWTEYSTPTNNYYLHDGSTPANKQRFLRNRVSWRRTNEGVSTVYSYDPHGHVEWLAQYIPKFGGSFMKYAYDVVGGTVRQLAYQEGTKDQFYQRYSYDADRRLTRVESSRDAVIWDRDADYDYALHGPMQRIELGEDRLQSLDYAHTINGWLKAVNQYPLHQSTSFGDGFQHGNYARDAFAMVLGYFNGDFVRTIGNTLIRAPWNSQSASPYHMSGPDLYNGNISSWTSQHAYANTPPSGRKGPIGAAYTYDVLNRLRDVAHLDSSANNVLSLGAGWYDEEFTYDPNGNITTLKRHGGYGTGGAMMDNLSYAYNTTPNPGAPRNRLERVSELAAASMEPNDIEVPQGGMLLPPMPSSLYHYDSSGNLTRDMADGSWIKWNAQGKMLQVRRMLPQPGAPPGGNYRQEIFFRYDPAGNRVVKAVLNYETKPGDLVEIKGNITYYVRDANEQVIAVYDRDVSHLPGPGAPCLPDYIPRVGPTAPANSDIDTLTSPYDPFAPTDDGVDHGCDNCRDPSPNGDPTDPFAGAINPWQEDSDGDLLGDACDPCPFDPENPCIDPHKILVPPHMDTRPFDMYEDVGFAVKLAELHIYGNSAQGRIAMYRPETNRDSSAFNAPQFTRALRKKFYEIKDHLGNVRVAISDVKLNGTGQAQDRGQSPWNPDVESYNDYYAFGMLMPERHWQADGYRYGFNGKEMDNEMKETVLGAVVTGVGNSYDYGSRIYSPQLARWLAVDPFARTYSGQSPYSFALNSPIFVIDPDGARVKPWYVVEYRPFSNPLSYDEYYDDFFTQESGKSFQMNWVALWNSTPTFRDMWNSLVAARGVIQVVETSDLGVDANKSNVWAEFQASEAAIDGSYRLRAGTDADPYLIRMQYHASTTPEQQVAVFEEFFHALQYIDETEAGVERRSELERETEVRVARAFTDLAFSSEDYVRTFQQEPVVQAVFAKVRRGEELNHTELAHFSNAVQALASGTESVYYGNLDRSVARNRNQSMASIDVILATFFRLSGARLPQEIVVRPTK